MRIRPTPLAVASALFLFSAAAQAAPAKPVIAWLPTSQGEAPLTIHWDMWWGENGDNWRILANGGEICAGSLTANGQNPQAAECTVTAPAGNYSLVAELCNASGCTISDTRTISIAGGGNVDTATPPGKPTIAWMPERYTYTEGMLVPFTWNMWWGENGDQWRLLVDGQTVLTYPLAAASTQAAQSASLDLPVPAPGTYTLAVALCKSAGELCTLSDSRTVVVAAGGATTPSPTPTPSPAPSPTPSGGPSMTQAQLDAIEAAKTDTPAMRQVKAAIATRGNAVVDAIQPGATANPANVQRVERLLPQTSWDKVFPLRAPEYTYRGFLQAVGKFPAFCGDYEDGRDADAICRKSLSTMFAHFAQETGAHETWRAEPTWKQGLFWVREMGWTEAMRGGYNAECNPATWQGQTWPCGTFDNGDYKSYFGRGAKQLSYNYNYGPFSEAMFGDVRVLLDQPELVADTWLNLASAVFFFVYPQPPKPSMLHVVDGTWQPNGYDLASGLVPGFGATTQIINGGVECGGSVENIQSQNRIDYYRSFSQYLGNPIAANEVLGCKGMQAFSESGAGALPIYWEQDWSWVAGNPEGKSYACKLVGYQTPFSAFKPGDYSRCVQYFFPDLVIADAPQATPTPAPTATPEPTATPTPTGTPAPAPTPTTSTPPAKPDIGWMPASLTVAEAANYPLTWNMWWGENGDHWKLVQNGNVVYTGSLTAAGNAPQTATTQLNLGAGNYSFTVQLCKGSGTAEICTSSAPATLNVVDGTTTAPSTGGSSGTPSGGGAVANTNIPYINTTGSVIGSYFVEWGVYGRNYHVADVPADNLTHLLYGFLAICGDNPSAPGGTQAAITSECQGKPVDSVTIVDRFAALEKSYPGDQWDDPVRGNFGQLARLKASHPDIVLLPSVGGWTLSDPFYAMAGNPSRRAVFAASVVQFLKTYPFFDGVDIDWEYPGGGGASSGKGAAADTASYTALMHDLRQALDGLAAETGRRYQLTAAVNVSVDKVNHVDYRSVAPYLDYIFAMTYDFYGAWSGVLGHQAGLYAATKEAIPRFNADAGVRNLEQAGVPAQKIVLGAALYGRGWQNVSAVQGNNPFTGQGGGAMAPGSWEAGVFDYKDIEANYLGGPGGSGINGYTAYWDDVAKAPYLWNPVEKKLISYDSARSVKEKAAYVRSNGLGGIFSWEIDADNGNLLNAIHEGLGHPKK